MAEEPGGPKGEIPWEEIWQRITGKKDNAAKGKPVNKAPVIWIIVGVVVVIWLLTGIYTVGPGEKGVVKRFGAHSGTTDPGLHYHLPSPFETVDKVNVEKIRVTEIGFRSMPGERFQPVTQEAQMLTGDENIVDAQVVVQYKVGNAADYLFNVVDPEQALATATEVALRGVVGRNTIDFVMIDGRSTVQSETMSFLQQLLDDYNSGFLITAVKLQYAGPPTEVKDAFDEVVRAREDKEKVIREAEGYAADRVPKARGEAEQTILAATAYREQRELKAEGDAAKFLKIVKEHEIPAAFQTLASIGIPEAVQVLAQVGIEQETLPEDDQESVAITRETLLDILDGIGVLDEGQTVEGLTGPILYQAFEQLEMADYYRAAYEKAMRLTEERLYLETMEDVLIDTEKIVIDSDAGGNLMPFLPLKDLTGQEAD